MNIREAIKARHSVRQFKDIPIGEAEAEKLKAVIDECNSESGLNIQLVLNDPDCFDTFLAHYGRFKNANNYIALVGSSSLDDLDERAGYYGQRIVLEAQMLGLGTCWVAGTYGKGKCKADKQAGEKIVCVIALGYGEDEGKSHKSKPLGKLCALKKEDMPAWFKNGMLAAVLAPTALNQQKFFIDIDGEDAVITPGRSPMAKIDLGIVRYNFEAASGHRCVPKVK
ncbi:MAG: nitroreductase family protein [Ruminococcus sp.]|nr:nitroreductase family protein [Ruminococcus sp.]